jgi:toxin-antitoxin system PIN domain toxin
MTLADANVLIAAFRTDHVHHQVCSEWLWRIIGSRERFGVASLVLLALVRVCTHRKVYSTPSTLREALGFCDNLVTQPSAQLVSAGPGHWPIFARLCVDQDIIGSDTTDAWLAALAMEHDCEMVTLDRDFGRYPSLRWRMP